jgi:hypothetical protein
MISASGKDIRQTLNNLQVQSMTPSNSRYMQDKMRACTALLNENSIGFEDKLALASVDSKFASETIHENYLSAMHSNSTLADVIRLSEAANSLALSDLVFTGVDGFTPQELEGELALTSVIAPCHFA